jgi:Alpha/beta hydrolase of unknown function (DUF900)
MKTHYTLFILFFLVISTTNIFAGANNSNEPGNDTAVQYLFVEWQHWNNTIVLGHFSKNQLKRITEVVYKVEEVDKSKINEWLKNAEYGALLSFHCMWGQQSWFHRQKYLFSFGEVVQSALDKKIKTVISFIWHSGGINYKKNWNQAAAKGEPLGKLFLLINEYYTGNTYIVCHSMGSRFFEGILTSIPHEQKICKAIILFSADLPADIHHTDFKLISNAAPSIAVFQHRQDKLLLISSIVFESKRLGRSGPLPEQNNIHVFDMTRHVRGFQNHAHLNKKWSKQKMGGFLNSLL